jgi:O-antigen ligase
MTEVATRPAIDTIPSMTRTTALRILQIGAIAAVLVASTYRVFDLDRFLVPKELILHFVALVAGALTLHVIRTLPMTRVDRLLMLYLLLGAISALLATNRWLGLRGLAVSASAVMVFWIARALRDTGRARAVVAGLVLAVVVAAMTSLMQTYGIRLDVFSLNRAPGGTLGNRNFIAHAMAFGLPLALFIALRSRRYILSAIGIAVMMATLVLTRSRAAWLAAAVVVLLLVFALVASPSLRRDGRTWRRIAGVVILAAGAVFAALLIPNTLEWRSDNPYAETAKSVTNYKGGSGQGRLAQYKRSLGVSIRHPLLGVGPGNWPVVYPRYAPRDDKSLSESEGGMTSNPWPSSDWIAFLTERGPAAMIVLALVFASLARTAFRHLMQVPDADDALRAAALLGTIAAALVAGAFDAVLLLAVPSLIIWAALGALATFDEPAHQTMNTPAVALVLLVVAAGAVYSATKLMAMDVYATTGDRASLEHASRLDPGSYRIHLRLAHSGRRASRCEHASAAHALFPTSDAATAAARGCGQ